MIASSEKAVRVRVRRSRGMSQGKIRMRIRSAAQRSVGLLVVVQVTLSRLKIEARPN